MSNNRDAGWYNTCVCKLDNIVDEILAEDRRALVNKRIEKSEIDESEVLTETPDYFYGDFDDFFIDADFDSHCKSLSFADNDKLMVDLKKLGGLSGCVVELFYFENEQEFSTKLSKCINDIASTGSYTTELGSTLTRCFKDVPTRDDYEANKSISDSLIKDLRFVKDKYKEYLREETKKDKAYDEIR